MEYSEAVEIVSEFFRIGQWSCNEYGERHAVLDNDIELRMFQENHDTMIIQGMFGEPMVGTSGWNTNEIKLKYLLQSNFIRIIHHNDVLSIDGKTDRLSTTRHIALRDITTEDLLHAIETFVQSVDFWDTIAKRKQTHVTMSPLLSLMRRK